MKFPEVTFGEERSGEVHIAPDISEQLELARRIVAFLDATRSHKVTPSLSSRAFEDIRVKQPSGMARLKLDFSREAAGRFAAEIHASHDMPKSETHYSLMPDGEHWLHRHDIAKPDSATDYRTHTDMVHDMLEYAPKGGRTEALLDASVDARAIVNAIVGDLGQRAHRKAGNDYYRTNRLISDGLGYAATRHLELSDSRINSRAIRTLSSTALINLGVGPVDITQTLSYRVRHDASGAIVEDGITLRLSSKDGLSKERLTELARTSDLVNHPFDVMYDALEELSLDTFINGSAA